MIVRCFLVLLPLAPGYRDVTLEQLDWSLVGKIQVVAVDRLWEHIPTV
ncbi:hypothetical protein Tco_0515522, partial [Tanacetum coccineum]